MGSCTFRFPTILANKYCYCCRCRCNLPTQPCLHFRS